MKKLAALSVLLVCIAQAAQPASAAGLCGSAAYHQFDFFVGDWDVTTPSGKPLGTDLVTKEYGGCVLIEKWHDAGDPGRGIGLTGYLPGRKLWHQDFMDDSGMVLAIDGGIVGSKMSMGGVNYQPNGAMRLHRVVWTARSDGTVEEVWKVSDDKGKTWRVHFDGLFRRIEVYRRRI